MPLADGPRLRPGSAHFHVEELPAYATSGSGEHLYVKVEKENLTTEVVAEALAKACGVRSFAVGFAGRKDRHGITRQWFSVHTVDDKGLANLERHLPGGGRLTVLTATRHANKLRLGHLAGNRFNLGIEGIADAQALAERFSALAHHGIRNRFGTQRFGVNGSNLVVARALAGGDVTAAVERIVDPAGLWRWGQPLPEGFRPGAEGRVLGALRHGADAAAALRSAGDILIKLIASAAQSAAFNAVLDARDAAGILHTLRVGDLGCNALGAPFLVTAEALDSTNERARPGNLDARTTGPLPGTTRLIPSPEVAAEERAWMAAVQVDPGWFTAGQVLTSPGERRPLLIPFREAPTVTAGESGLTWVAFALPPGAYATEVLGQVGVAIPEDRRGL